MGRVVSVVEATNEIEAVSGAAVSTHIAVVVEDCALLCIPIHAFLSSNYVLPEPIKLPGACVYICL